MGRHCCAPFYLFVSFDIMLIRAIMLGMKSFNQEYLRSTMFGIENSLISTVGLIAGMTIGTSDKNVVVLGAVVAIAIESLAMGVGEYLSDDAVQELDKIKRHPDNPLLSGALMTAAGTVAGLVPLLPVILLSYPYSLTTSILAALFVLFMVGYIKGRVLHSKPILGGLKIMTIGGLATALGVLVGLIFRI